MAFQQIEAIESSSAQTAQYQLAEKGSKAKSKSKIIAGDNLSCFGGMCSGPTGPQGAAGPKGSTGAQGEPFTPAYAVAVQECPKNFGEVVIDDIILLPFSSLEYAQGITFDSTTDTFTLPKGVFTLHFQFMTDDRRVMFDPVYLKIGGCDLTLARTSTVYDPDNSLSSFSGSTIFEIPADGTEVQLYAKVLAIAYGGSRDLIITDPNTGQNYPVRIVFQKIGEIC